MSWAEQIVQGLRLVMGISWAVIAVGGVDSLARVWCRKHRREQDVYDTALSLVGIGLVILAFSALSGRPAAPPDAWTMAALWSLCVAGVIVLLRRSTRAPYGHRKAAVIASLGIIGLAFIAGTLA